MTEKRARQAAMYYSQRHGTLTIVYRRDGLYLYDEAGAGKRPPGDEIIATYLAGKPIGPTPSCR